MTRAWFRRRLDANPRRWVLLLAALQGLCGFALTFPDEPALLKGFPGATVVGWLVLASLAPSLGVIAMLVQGRLLWWTGRALGGRARPEELHTAFAWSALPFTLATSLVLVTIPFRAAVVFLDPLPVLLQLGSDIERWARGGLGILAAIAGVFSTVLHVRFSGEAQGLGVLRAVANHLLAVILGLVLLIGPIAGVDWLVSR